MVYMGSKNRIAKEMLPIILQDLQPDQWYVEPFVGGCNMIDKFEHKYKIGVDNNKYLIALLKTVQSNEIKLPEEITRDEYMNIKNNKDNYPEWLVGFAGFCCSFRGKFGSGYASNYVSEDSGRKRNYQKTQIASLLKQQNQLKGINLICSEYSDFIIPDNSLIYCDPPYANTAKYSKDGFDSESFWQWCREKVKEGHKVFVSEYNAPDDFVCVWQKELICNLGSTSKKTIEKLFVHHSQL